jgi:hypothetical protein
LGASLAVVVVIFLRDRDPSNWLPPQRRVAYSDAMSVAAVLGGTCPRECSVRLVDHPRADHWTERIEIPTATMCVDIDVRAFDTGAHGIGGVRRVACGP